MKPIFALVLSVLFTSIFAAPAHAQRMVIFVRHAEKEAGSGDVAISAAGKKRADELARLLKDTSVDAIYTTTYLRTKQTADPLAALLKTSSKQLPNSETPQMLKKRLAKDHADQCVLIVGHSNTIPTLIDAITGRPNNITIADDQYDGLFMLVAKPGDKWCLVRARY